MGEDLERGMQAFVVEGWGPVLARTGQEAEARHWARIARPIYEAGHHDLGAYHVTLVELGRATDDWDEAVRAVEDALVQPGHYLATYGETVAVAMGFAADRACSALPEPETLGLVDRWIACVDRCLAEAPGRGSIEDLAMFIDQARLERERLAGNDSAERWEELAARWEPMPRPYQAAYCRFRAAFALATCREGSRAAARERAAGHLAAALALCAELGAVVLEGEIRELMRQARIRLPSRPAQGAAPEPRESELFTPRELDVLRLLVDGLTNGQIAVRLGISRSTASVHVSNILGKLGAANRVEAAVRAGRLGLVGR
jgi:DNA-binding NarL/FixJ family response regulator